MGDGLEDLQAGRGRLARLPFEVVRDVAEEFEAVFGGPEEGVGQDRCGVGAGGFVSVGTCWMGWMGVVSYRSRGSWASIWRMRSSASYA